MNNDTQNNDISGKSAHRKMDVAIPKKLTTFNNPYIKPRNQLHSHNTLFLNSTAAQRTMTVASSHTLPLNSNSIKIVNSAETANESNTAKKQEQHIASTVYSKELTIPILSIFFAARKKALIKQLESFYYTPSLVESIQNITSLYKTPSYKYHVNEKKLQSDCITAIKRINLQYATITCLKDTFEKMITQVECFQKELAKLEKHRTKKSSKALIIDNEFIPQKANSLADAFVILIYKAKKYAAQCNADTIIKILLNDLLNLNIETEEEVLVKAIRIILADSTATLADWENTLYNATYLNNQLKSSLKPDVKLSASNMPFIMIYLLMPHYCVELTPGHDQNTLHRYFQAMLDLVQIVKLPVISSQSSSTETTTCILDNNEFFKELGQDLYEEDELANPSLPTIASDTEDKQLDLSYIPPFFQIVELPTKPSLSKDLSNPLGKILSTLGKPSYIKLKEINSIMLHRRENPSALALLYQYIQKKSQKLFEKDPDQYFLVALSRFFSAESDTNHNILKINLTKDLIGYTKDYKNILSSTAPLKEGEKKPDDFFNKEHSQVYLADRLLEQESLERCEDYVGYNRFNKLFQWLRGLVQLANKKFIMSNGDLKPNVTKLMGEENLTKAYQQFGKETIIECLLSAYHQVVGSYLISKKQELVNDYPFFILTNYFNKIHNTVPLRYPIICELEQVVHRLIYVAKAYLNEHAIKFSASIKQDGIYILLGILKDDDKPEICLRSLLKDIQSISTSMEHVKAEKIVPLLSTLSNLLNTLAFNPIIAIEYQNFFNTTKLQITDWASKNIIALRNNYFDNNTIQIPSQFIDAFKEVYRYSKLRKNAIIPPRPNLFSMNIPITEIINIDEARDYARPKYN